MKLEKVDITGLNDIYVVPAVKKEFVKTVNEQWKNRPPWERYQKRLIRDLAVLDMQKERAIDFPQYEKLSGEKNLYSIRHPESRKNVRVIYTIVEGTSVILLAAFLENNDGDYQNAIRCAKNRLKLLNS